MLSRLLNTEQSPFLGKVRHQSVLRMTRQGDRPVIYNRQMTDMPATTTTDRLKTGRNVELQTWGHSWSNHKGIRGAFFSNCTLDVFWCIWGCLWNHPLNQTFARKELPSQGLGPGRKQASWMVTNMGSFYLKAPQQVCVPGQTWVLWPMFPSPHMTNAPMCMYGVP